MIMFFSKIAAVTWPRTLKLKIVEDNVILHIYGKLNQNRSINEGARAMTTLF